MKKHRFSLLAVVVVVALILPAASVFAEGGCDCPWVSEGAWAEGARYTSKGNWATYTPYVAGDVVTLFADQSMDAGSVHFSAAAAGEVTITITLPAGWRFADIRSNVQIQGYAAAPSGNPSPGKFANKGDADPGELVFSIAVPASNYYGVHVNVEWHDCSCDNGGDGTDGLPATSNWLMIWHSDWDGDIEYALVMNVDGSTISGTLTQSGSPVSSPYSGTLDGLNFVGTWVSTIGLPYVGAIEWTFNSTYTSFTGGFWAANAFGDPYMFYLGPISGTIIP